MGRNVVVCCDGTANMYAQNNTNVVKLYSALIDDPARQIIFYHPGIGTWEAPGALTDWGVPSPGWAFGLQVTTDGSQL